MGLWWGQELLCPRLGHIMPGPNPGQPPLFPGIWGQVEQRPYGTSLCFVWSWGCSSCSPNVSSPAPPRVPQSTAACGGHVLQADPQKPPCALSSPKPLPTQPPGCLRRVPALSKGVHRRVPVAQGTRTAGAGNAPGRVHVSACVCPPYVCVCACACGGRARPQLGAPTARPAAAPAPAPVRGAGEAAGVGSPKRGTGRRNGAAQCGHRRGGQTERRSGSRARCTGHSSVRERGTGGQRPAGKERPVRGSLVESQGHRSQQGVSEGFGKVGRAVRAWSGKGRARWDDAVRRGRCRVQGTGAAQSGGRLRGTGTVRAGSQLRR